MKEKISEYALHRQIVDFLRVALAGNSTFFHPPNGGYRLKVEGAKLKAMGVLPGLPDLGVINDGRIRWIEIKAPKGRVSAAQHEAHRKLRQAGATVDVCYSLDQVIMALLTHGVPLRTAARIDGAWRHLTLDAPTEPTRTRIGRRVLS